MSSTIGGAEWSQQTGGKLNFRDRLSFITQAVFLQMRSQLRRRTSAGIELLGTVDLDAIRIPDTSIVQQAMQLCQEVSSASLANHCLRTYFWGAILGQRDHIRYDEELFVVAALLHDLGLTPAYHGKDPTAQCFAVEGGRAAAQFAAKAGWNEQHCNQVYEAIVRHLNLQVALEEGAEAHLIQAGAALDVIGLRYRQISPETVKAVLQRYPRLGFKQELDTLMSLQIQQRPNSRIALLYQIGKFGERIQKAPFEE